MLARIHRSVTVLHFVALLTFSLKGMTLRARHAGEPLSTHVTWSLDTIIYACQRRGTDLQLCQPDPKAQSPP